MAEIKIAAEVRATERFRTVSEEQHIVQHVEGVHQAPARFIDAVVVRRIAERGAEVIEVEPGAEIGHTSSFDSPAPMRMPEEPNAERSAGFRTRRSNSGGTGIFPGR